MKTGFLALAAALVLGCAGAAPLPRKALELNRDGAQALARGELELADARLSVALEYSPHFVEALVNLGLVELERGNFARARQLFERARRLNADVAQPHHGLGLLCERERRRDRAAEHYREALRVDPGFGPARANLGRLLFESGQLEEARITFARLVEIAPDDPRGYWGLAECLIRLGRLDEADRFVHIAHARFPDHPATELLIARALLRAGRPDEASARLVPLVGRRDEFSAAALSWLAMAELLRDRPRHAIGAAERALALEPEQPVATHALAEALARLGDPAAALWKDRAVRMRAP